MLVDRVRYVAVRVPERFPDRAADSAQFLLVPRLPLPELVNLPVYGPLRRPCEEQHEG